MYHWHFIVEEAFSFSGTMGEQGKFVLPLSPIILLLWDFNCYLDV